MNPVADGAELTYRVNALEKGLAMETEKREQGEKYRHRMAEDNQARFGEIKSDIGGLRSGFMAHLEDDKALYTMLGAIDMRLRRVEQMVWIAAGGVLVIGGLVGILGANILRLLAK